MKEIGINMIKEIFKHLEFTRSLIKELGPKNKRQKNFQEKQLKNNKIFLAYWGILLLFSTKLKDSEHVELAWGYIQKCSGKITNLDSFGKAINKICKNTKGKSSEKIYNKVKGILNVKDLKELQEYKSLWEPVRIGSATELPQITDYLMNKVYKKKQNNSLYQDSYTKTIYSKLGEGRKFSQPILKIHKKRRLNSACNIKTYIF